MFWMGAYTLRGEVWGGWALEFPSFLGAQMKLAYRTCLSGPSCSYLSILSCLCCPVSAALSVLSCRCFSCLFNSSRSLLAFLTWLSCLDYHFVLFPDHSYPTIILSLSCFSCPACSVCCPILLLPFLAILFCPESFILSFLSLLSCSRIFCMDYHLLQIFMKQLFRPVYPVLLYIPFCPLLSCSDLIILYSFAISISNSCPSVSAKVLLSWSVFSHLSCLSIPFCSDPAVLSYHSCLHFLSLYCLATPSLLPLQHSPAPRHLTHRLFLLWIHVLSIVVLPVTCPVCHPNIFCLRSSIQTHSAIYSPSCHSQVFVNQ